MLLMVGGMLLWGGTVAFFLPSVFPQIISLLTIPWNSWLLQLIGMLIALVIAVQALFSQSPASQPGPQDDALYDVGSSHEQARFFADPSRE
jgi:hypothetical protein